MENSEILKNIRNTLRIFCKSNDIVELRIIKTDKGTISGFFEMTKEIMPLLLNAVSEYVDSHSIYFTINSPKPELLKLSNNKMTSFSRTTTKDADIAHLNWLHIDLDPIRSANSSSTEGELAAARAKAIEIKQALAEKFGILNPIVSMSGNGINIDYYSISTCSILSNKV